VRPGDVGPLSRNHGTQHPTEKKNGRASIADLEETLDNINGNYRVQDPGIRNKAILRYAARKKLGTLVGFRELSPGAGRHIVTRINYATDEVRVLDSNDSDGRIPTMPLKTLPLLVGWFRPDHRSQ
jgi:hypothetical protein